MQSYLGGWPGQDDQETVLQKPQLQSSEFVSTQSGRWVCNGLHGVWNWKDLRLNAILATYSQVIFFQINTLSSLSLIIGKRFKNTISIRVLSALNKTFHVKVLSAYTVNRNTSIAYTVPRCSVCINFT